jgi:hypothetical protein
MKKGYDPRVPFFGAARLEMLMRKKMLLNHEIGNKSLNAKKHM